MKYVRENHGFTLAEILVYSGLLAIIASLFGGALLTTTRIQVSQNTSTQLTRQLRLTSQTLQRFVRDASVIDIEGNTPTSILVVRMQDEAKDPTRIYLENGCLFIQEGANAPTAMLDCDTITVDDISFVRIPSYPAHDAVEITLTLSKSGSNDTLVSLIGRASAAAFDGHLLPGADDMFDLGSPTNRWRDLWLSGSLVMSDDPLTLGSSTFDPSTTLAGSIYYNTTNQTIKMFNGTTWESLKNYWNLSGNDITNTNGGDVTVTNQIKILGGAPGTGKVLTSDITGLASWQNPIGGGGGGDGSGLWATSTINANDISNTNTGNVGIGTSNPGSSLEIYRTGITPSLKLNKSDAGGEVDLVFEHNGTQMINYYDGSKLKWYKGGDLVTIQNNGNVGIGTVSPLMPLEIGAVINGIASSGATPTGGFRIRGASPFFNTVLDMGIGAGSNANGWLQVTNATNLSSGLNLLLNPIAGNVGIGTMSPTVKLDINGTAGQPTSMMFERNGVNEYEIGQDGVGVIIHKAYANWPIQFRNSSNNSIMTINTGTQSVGIGTSNPGSSLEIYRTGITPSLKLNKSDAGGEVDLVFEHNGTQMINYYDGSKLKWYKGGDLVTIQNNGNVGIGTADPTEKLHVNGTTRFDGNVGIGGSPDPYAKLYVNSGGLDTGIFSHGGIGFGVTGVGYGGPWSGQGAPPPAGQGTGIYGTGYYGVRGNGSLYDFYADGPGANYGPFTGSHEVKLATNFPTTIQPGLIVSANGKTTLRSDAGETGKLSSTLPTVILTQEKNNTQVLGVIIQATNLQADHWYLKQNPSDASERFAIINALGEGRVWVTNIYGDINVGDYITSSGIPGYGGKQDNDLLHNYTLGKAIESVDWNTVTDYIDYNGIQYKKYLIAVVYTSG